MIRNRQRNAPSYRPVGNPAETTNRVKKKCPHPAGRLRGIPIGVVCYRREGMAADRIRGSGENGING